MPAGEVRVTFFSVSRMILSPLRKSSTSQSTRSSLWFSEELGAWTRLPYILASSTAFGSRGETMVVPEGAILRVLARSSVETGPITTSKDESLSAVTGMLPPTAS